MIYLDLDETLLLTDRMMCGREGSVEFEIEDYGFCTMRRPRIRHFIACCKMIAPTRILTMGTRDYALAAIEATGLGFKPDEVVSRCDFISGDICGWVSREDISTKATNVCPRAVLVDNQPDSELFAELKMEYLGIDKSRYIQIASFMGKDHSGFPMELNNILCRIKKLLS